ncbi:MAG: hypothetical protein AAGB12_06140, partial [Pseudomonadota bacterium]
DTQTLPVVRVAIGMDPAEVMENSSYPVELYNDSLKWGNVDPKYLLDYDTTMSNSDVDFDIVGPHPFRIENVSMWSIQPEFDRINTFQGKIDRLTLDDAFVRVKKWAERIEQAGWVRGKNKYDQWTSTSLYTNKLSYLGSDEELRQQFLRRDNLEAKSGSYGIWYSEDGRQRVIIGVFHLTESNLRRWPDTSKPSDPFNDPTYMIKFIVMYTDEILKEQQQNYETLKQEALRKAIERRKQATGDSGK